MAQEDMAKTKDSSVGKGVKYREATSPDREKPVGNQNKAMPSSMGGGVNNLKDTLNPNS